MPTRVGRPLLTVCLVWGCGKSAGDGTTPCPEGTSVVDQPTVSGRRAHGCEDGVGAFHGPYWEDDKDGRRIAEGGYAHGQAVGAWTWFARGSPRIRGAFRSVGHEHHTSAPANKREILERKFAAAFAPTRQKVGWWTEWIEGGGGIRMGLYVDGKLVEGSAIESPLDPVALGEH